MTIIVALKDRENKRVILGNDRQATKGQIVHKVESKCFSLPVNIEDEYGKVVETAKIHFLFSGQTYLKNFLQYGMDIPNIRVGEYFVGYLYNAFFPLLQEILTKQQLVEIDNSQIDTGSALIIVFKGNVYHIQYNLGVNILEDEFIVEGSGYEVAVGSLLTNLKYHSEMNRVDMVKQAIIVTGESTVYCDTDVELKVINY